MLFYNDTCVVGLLSITSTTSSSSQKPIYHIPSGSDGEAKILHSTSLGKVFSLISTLRPAVTGRARRKDCLKWFNLCVSCGFIFFKLIWFEGWCRDWREGVQVEIQHRTFGQAINFTLRVQICTDECTKWRHGQKTPPDLLNTSQRRICSHFDQSCSNILFYLHWVRRKIVPIGEIQRHS